MTFFLYGFYALLAQTLLLRELAQVFGAHELALAGALAAWVFWTAAGVFLAAKLKPAAAGNGPALPSPYFAAAGVLLAAAVPANILAARLAPALFSPGLQPGLFLMLAGPALLALPAGLVNGLAAGFGLARLPARFYALEAAGAAAAGALTVAYFHYFPQFSALALLTLPALALAAACALRRPFPKFRLAGFALAAAALFCSNAVERSAWRLRPPAARPGVVIQTRGSRLAVTEPAGKQLFYEDGRLLAAPEDPAWEELAHIPLLAVKRPRRVLLTGSGAFFLLPEVLKHKPKEVDIAEPDVFKSWFLAGRAGSAGNVRTLPFDLRGLPAGAPPYDAIFQTVPSPDNAALNRNFTVEFFRAAAARLRPGGLLVFQLPFADNYLPPEKAYVIASVLAAARQAFPAVELLPGVRLTVLAGSKAPDLTADILTAAYLKRGLKTTTVLPSAFPFMLDPYRRAWAAHELEKVKNPVVNSDLSPLAYFHFWRAWLSMVVSPGSLLGLAALALCALCAGLLLAGRLSFTPERRTGEAFLIGFWGMAFETALLLAFQARTGQLNPQLGGLFAAFMAAAAAGALLPLKAGKTKPLAIELLAAALALICAFKAEVIFAGTGGAAVWYLIAAGGLLTGAFFASAAGKAGADIYAWDLLGGAAGVFTTAAFAVPLLGIKGALLTAALAALAAGVNGVRSCISTKC